MIVNELQGWWSFMSLHRDAPSKVPSSSWKLWKTFWIISKKEGMEMAHNERFKQEIIQELEKGVQHQKLISKTAQKFDISLAKEVKLHEV